MEFVKGVWSDAELEILKGYYTEGYAKLIEKGLRRTEAAVKQKAKFLGIYIKKEKPNEWSEDEVKLLVESYTNDGLQGALNCGLNKKDLSIKTKIRMLGLSGNENEGVLWNKQRIDILLNYYPTEGAKGVRKRGVKEAKDIILAKAIELGLGVKF